MLSGMTHLRAKTNDARKGGKNFCIACHEQAKGEGTRSDKVKWRFRQEWGEFTSGNTQEADPGGVRLVGGKCVRRTCDTPLLISFKFSVN